MSALDRTLTRLTDFLLRSAAPAPARKSILWGADQPYYVTGGGPFSTTYGTSINYAQAAGDLSGNSAIMACIGWLMRAEPEAPWRLQRRQGEQLTTLYDHALLSLLLRPNPYYSGLALRQATVLSYNLAGNAYWRKVRNGAGRVVELWYEPHFTIRAVGGGDTFLSHYQVYRKEGGRYGWLDVDPADVIHFRDGLDPVNPRYGLSRLASVLRDVATDQEAARYSYSMLSNTGIIPVVYSPKDEKLILRPADAQAIKDAHQRNFTGDHRGEVAVMSTALDVHRISIPPDEMSAETLHRVPESRIAANLDVPAVIVGLLVGLEHSTYSNMEQAREHAYEGNLIPYQRTVADTIQHQLVPEFDDPARLLADFDLSNIRVLQEDQTAKVERTTLAFEKGVVTLNEARANIGMPPVPAGDAFQWQLSGGAPVSLLPAPARNGNGAAVGGGA